MAREKKERRLLLRAAFSLLFMLLLSEAAARLLTRAGSLSPADNGMPRLGKVALLPFHPDPETVRKLWDLSQDSGYVIRDAELGWTVGPSRSTRLYASNSQCIRTLPDHVYDPGLPKEKSRMVVVGDSFTHGDASSLEDTWTTQLEKINPALEVLNFGVPGFGTDQAFLRWRRDARKFKSHYVLLGIFPENICRNLNVVRYYLVPVGNLASKPRLVLENGRLTAINSPVFGRDELATALASPEKSSILKLDAWCRPAEQEFPLYYHLRLARVVASFYNAYQRREDRNRLYSGADPAGIEITIAIAHQFAEEARGEGAIPLVLIIPMRDLLDRYPGPDSLPLTVALRKAGLEVIDPGPVFASKVARDGAGAYYADHFTPAGNRLLAEEVAKQLAQRSAK